MTEIIVIIIFVNFFVNINSDCGTPAIPMFASLMNDQKQFIIPSERFREHERLSSVCSNGSYAIGSTIRKTITCKDGNWEGSLRKCGM